MDGREKGVEASIDIGIRRGLFWVGFFSSGLGWVYFYLRVRR